MIINLNEFGGGSVSPEEIEEIVNENHYTKEESDEIVNDVRDIADEAKTIAEAKQDILVSGTNIKTINGEDILGEGDIEIKGGDTNPCFVHLVFTDDTERIDYLTKNCVPTSAYTNDTTIKKVLVGDGIKGINPYAFKGCTNLGVIVLPDTLESIGDYAFSYTKENAGLTLKVGKTFNTGATIPISGLTFPNSLIQIGNYAFSGKKTSSDVGINIGTNLKRIGDSAFSSFGNIIRITTPENDVKEHSLYGDKTIFLQNVTTIGVSAFNGVLGNKVGSSASTSLHLSVTTGYGSTSFFPSYVFANNIGLKYVYIGRDEKNYMNGNYFFNFCENMFRGCTNLNYIWINPMVTSITVSSDAFRGCSSTGTLYCSKEAYDSITSKSALGPVANWTVKFIETDSNKISTLETDVTTLKTDVNEIKEDIKNIELVKSPNVTLFGNWDSFNSGQLKNFSTTKYAQFPFLVDLNNRSYLDSWEWSIDFEITPNSSTSQHNIFDSNYGLAFAIRDGHFVIAYSNDGTTWTRELTGTNTLTSNTTYKVKIGYSYLDGNVDFHVNYSTDGGTTWVNDIMGDGGDVRPYPTQIIIGKALNNSNSFDGIINLNECKLIINGEVKWQGMDDVGLSTRLATDMSNIDAAGVQKVKDIIGGYTLSVLTQAEYDALEVKDSNTIYLIK